MYWDNKKADDCSVKVNFSKKKTQKMVLILKLEGIPKTHFFKLNWQTTLQLPSLPIVNYAILLLHNNYEIIKIGTTQQQQ